MNIPTGCLVLFLVCQNICSADIRQWTDSAGQIHYGDIPPAGSKTTQPDLQPAFSSDSPGLRPSERRALKQIRKSERRRASAKDRARKVYRKKRREKAAFCEKTARQLRKLTSEGDPDSRWTRSDLHRQRRQEDCH